MKTMLSTKILTSSQKELLLNAGLGLVEYSAIQISLQDFQNLEGLQNYQNVVFTSKNSFYALQNSEFRIQNCFCVGSATKKLLEENGQKVVEMAPNASELAKIIVKKYKKEQFLFLCGNLRREELPDILKKNNIAFEERMVYKTELNLRKFDRDFDGIMFFSPSGVQSYCTDNKINNSIVFCIGDTTASEVRKHTDTIIIANQPTIENVIVQAVKHFKNNS